MYHDVVKRLSKEEQYLAASVDLNSIFCLYETSQPGTAQSLTQFIVA